MPPLVASAHQSDAREKTMMPCRKIRRRPRK
jgi:hypothetical protein